MATPPPAYKGDGAYVFICYAHEDKSLVHPEIVWLQEQGVNVWYDEGVSPGEEWSEELGRAIDNADQLVFFVTPAAVRSRHCRNEVHYAQNHDTPIVAIHLRETRLPAGLELSLGPSQAILAHESSETYRGKLLGALQVSTTSPNPPDEGRPAYQRIAAASPIDSASSRVSRRWLVSLSAGATIVLVILAAYVALRQPQPYQPPYARLSARPAVAVLPVSNLTGDAAYDYLSIGLMDEIIVSLHRLRSFPVISRGAVLALNDRNNRSVTGMADQLGAAYVMDASMREDGNSLRVLATLSDAEGKQVWAQRFSIDDELKSLFPIVQEISGAIAGALRSSEVNRVMAVERPPVAAWEHYVKALSIIYDWSPEQHEHGLMHAREAIELDPRMAEAWWSLGELEATGLMLKPQDQAEYQEKLETVAGYFRRAHEISPFHGAACGCLGMTLAALGRWEEALALLEEALESNPLSSALRIDYALVLVAHGSFDRGRELAESATRMEPIGKDLGVIHLIEAIVDLSDGDWDAAEGNAHRALFAHPTNELVMPTAMLVLYIVGDFEGALRTYHQLFEAFPDFDVENPWTMLQYEVIDQILAKQAEGRELPESWREIVRDLAS